MKEQYFELKSKGLKRAEIAAIFNIPEWKLKKIISAEGWGVKRPIIGNQEAFNYLTAESCYWGGFIGADGCITGDFLKIMLNYDDTSHLEKFKAFIQSTHAISSNTDKYYRSEIGFKNGVILNGLKTHFNITPNKSGTYRMPTIPKDLFRHYLRGYFDGDGCICESFSNKNSTTATIYTTICGSNYFIPELENSLFTILNIRGTVAQKSRHQVLKYCTNASKTLLDFMYKDSNIYLERKYQLYKRIMVDNIRMTR